MNKMFCFILLAFIATSSAQMDDDDSFEAAGDGDSGEESREVAGSDDFDDRFSGDETRQNVGFTSDVPFGQQLGGMTKRSIDDVSDSLVRVRRGYKHQGVVGPVFTHVKTDHHGNFKWGVKHKVGGGHHH